MAGDSAAADWAAFEAQADERGGKQQMKQRRLRVSPRLAPPPLPPQPAGRPITSPSSHVAVSKADKCQAVSRRGRFTRAGRSSSRSLRASDRARREANGLSNAAAAPGSLTPP